MLVLKKRFLKCFYHILAWQPSWSCELTIYIKICSLSHSGSVWNKTSIVSVVSQMLESVNGWMDDRPLVYYKLTLWAKNYAKIKSITMHLTSINTNEDHVNGLWWQKSAWKKQKGICDQNPPSLISLCCSHKDSLSLGKLSNKSLPKDWSDKVDAKAEVSLPWVHMPYYCFYHAPADFICKICWKSNNPIRK